MQTTANTPTLSNYDLIVVNSSAGKDSQAMLDYVMELAKAEGVTDRVLVVHCDLGRVEWKGTRELAEEQAAHYGLRFIAVSRPQGDLLDQVEARGMWPSSTARFCTSDHKRAQVYKVFTQLVAEQNVNRPVRILNCQGIRSQESPARAKKTPFQFDKMASNGKRTIDTWFPIFDWTVGEVWARIKASGVRSHYAYELGMPRLSCAFCIFAPVKALVLAGQHNTELLAEYVRVEIKTGHKFRVDTSLVQIQAMVQAGGAPADAKSIESWCM